MPRVKWGCCYEWKPPLRFKAYVRKLHRCYTHALPELLVTLLYKLKIYKTKSQKWKPRKPQVIPSESNSVPHVTETSKAKKKKRQNYPCNRPWRSIGLWDVEAPISSPDNRLTNGDKVVSLTRRPPFTPPGRLLVLIFVKGWVDPRAIVRLEGLGKFKNPPHWDSNPRPSGL
jgi:hypothetical protein